MPMTPRVQATNSFSPDGSSFFIRPTVTDSQTPKADEALRRQQRICAYLSRIERARRNRQGDCPPTQGKYSKQINIKERSNMTKTSEKRIKTSTKLGLTVCLGVLPLLYGITGCSTGKHPAQNSPRNEEYSSMVGPAGPEGPAGPQGAKGTIGATGAPGAGVAGAIGEQGPSGPTGSQGAVGATGTAGAVARGQSGKAGNVGPAGAQGAVGGTGDQGAST